MELRLNQLAQKMNGKVLQGSPSLCIREFNIDSRLIKPGGLFFALIAERNGHDFIPQAAKKRAAGAVVSQDVIIPDKDFALIQVNNTIIALQELARKVCAGHNVKVVGITGSIGKTTTKEFAAALLTPRFKVLKSEGSYNNHIGLPLSLLNLEKDHDIAVLEMGMNHTGEIRRLTQIAPPQMAVITNVQPVHLEFFENLEGVAEAKKEILDGLDSGGTAILNADDPWVMKIASDWEGERILFGLSDKCDVYARNIRKEGFKGMTFELFYGSKCEKTALPFFYKTTLFNYLAAVAVGYALSLPFEDILERTQSLDLFKMRGTVFHLRKEMILIDDSYNSNPTALESILKAISELPGKRKIAVLGDMLELGKKSEKFHLQAGKQVVKFGFDALFTVGTQMRHAAKAAVASGMPKDHVYSFHSSEEAAAGLWALLERGDIILVKGSRGIKMEKIVTGLKERGN